MKIGLRTCTPFFKKFWQKLNLATAVLQRITREHPLPSVLQAVAWTARPGAYEDRLSDFVCTPVERPVHCCAVSACVLPSRSVSGRAGAFPHPSSVRDVAEAVREWFPTVCFSRLAPKMALYYSKKFSQFVSQLVSRTYARKRTRFWQRLRYGSTITHVNEYTI